MEFIVGKIYMDTQAAYSHNRYIYLGDGLLLRFMNTEEWHGRDVYILRSYTFGLRGLQECQDTFHSGWVNTPSGYSPILYSGQPPGTLASMDEVMAWLCSPEGFDENGEKAVLLGVTLQVSNDGHIHYGLGPLLRDCSVNPLKMLEDMNEQV